MYKGQGTTIQALIMIILIIGFAFFMFWFVSHSGNLVREMNIAETELLKTINTYYLTEKSLGMTWFISTLQAIFNTGKSALGEYYWYQTDPSRQKNIDPVSSFPGLTGCNTYFNPSANPKLCNMGSDDIESKVEEEMVSYLPAGVWDDDLLGVNIYVSDATSDFEANDDNIKSVVNHELDLEYGRNIDIKSLKTYETVIDTYLKQIVDYGKLIVEMAIELSQEDYTYQTYNTKVGYLTRILEFINANLTEISEEVNPDVEGEFSSGRILRIKIDPGDEPTEVWQFYLTDTPDDTHDCKPGDDNEITQQDLSDGLCDICVSNEEAGWIGGGDKFSHWKILPRGKIPLDTEDTWNVYTGVRDYLDSVSGDYKAGPYPVNETVGGQEYEDTPGNDHCGNDDDDDNNCMYLKTINDKHYWSPLYEIICDDDGYWKVCDTEDTTLTIGEKKYKCEGGAWVPLINFNSEAFINLIAPNQAYGTTGLLHHQGGLLLHYNILGSFEDPEEKYYYHDEENSQFVKDEISLDVRAEDYFVALDCTGLEQRYYFDSYRDLLCYGDDLYTCNRDIIEIEWDVSINTVDAQHKKADGEMVSDYMCVTCDETCNMFCREEERKNTGSCCIGWVWNDGLPDGIFCGTYCNGDGEITSSEVCDFRNRDGICASLDTSTSGCYQYCDKTRHVLRTCSMTDCSGYSEECSSLCGAPAVCDGRQPYECFDNYLSYCDYACNKQDCGQLKNNGNPYCEGLILRDTCTKLCTGNFAPPCDCDGPILADCSGTGDCIYYGCRSSGCYSYITVGASCAYGTGICDADGNCVPIPTSTTTTTIDIPMCCYDPYAGYCTGGAAGCTGYVIPCEYCFYVD